MKPCFIKFSYKKRSFLLIEILVAFSIIALISIPLIRNPICFCQTQIRSLEKLECERIAELSFLDIKVKLLKNEISSIPKNVKDAQVQYLPSYFLDSFRNQEIKRTFIVYSKKEKFYNDETFKFVHIKIFLKPANQKDFFTYKYKTIYKIPSKISL
ncbi:MAG: hypothetical protein WCT85_03230 [Parachlamydiales bacterium]|jgi:hypothetical protein